MNDKMTLIQYAIEKYEKEEVLVEKLKNILPEKDIQRNLDTPYWKHNVCVELVLKFYKIIGVIQNYQICLNT